MDRELDKEAAPAVAPEASSAAPTFEFVLRSSVSRSEHHADRRGPGLLRLSSIGLSGWATDVRLRA